MTLKETKLLELYRAISSQLIYSIESNHITEKSFPKMFHWLKASLLEVNDIEKKKDNMCFLSTEEIYTIIEGLRSLQRHDCGDEDILNDEAIDDLCVDLNFS